ncbi:MAG: L-2-hydroxyglutarate oxidase [Salibacteraceae bacterium]
MDLENSTFDFAIVGAGIVGAATAFKLSQKHPGCSILVIEKEDRVAPHQTGNNSGVIHSGIYYKPGSYKAKNCVDGRRQLVAFARQHQINHDICGKLIVATHHGEVERLEAIFQRGIENGVEDIELVGPEAIRQIEPYCEGVAAIRVGCTGIIDFKKTTSTLIDRCTHTNPLNRLMLNCTLERISSAEDAKLLVTNRGNLKARFVIFCGGLQADRLAHMDGLELDMAILGFRGDYYILTEQGRQKVKNLIYPVPDPKFPFLGVHFTRMTDGNVECGPNAVFVFKREGYGKFDFSLKDTMEALSNGGTWKFFAKHWKFGLDEYRRALSKKLFLTQLKRLIPALELEDLGEERAGVRAMALSNDGEMIDDFKIEYGPRSLHVLNAPSPAATACLAIADEIVKRVGTRYKPSAV